MKILHVITRGDCGGAQVALLNLVRHMPAGYEVVVAAGEEGYLRDQCEKHGIRFLFVRDLVRDVNPLRDVLSLGRLVILIRRENPDVVHAHTSKAGINARIAAWVAGKPSVFTAHSWSFDNGLSRFVEWLAVPMERVAAHISGPIIAVSEANARKAISNSIAPKKKIIRVWLGIPDSSLRAAPGGAGPIKMIMVSRFAIQKDHQLLLRSVASISGDWILQLVGNGPFLDSSKRLAKELDIENRVEFLGERSDVPELLSQAHIFVLASKWEGLPVCILEAMRAGLPIVASDVGGVKEMVTVGVNGFVPERGDASQLHHSLENLIESRELRIKMGEASRSRYRKDFQIISYVQGTCAVYGSLFRKTRPEPSIRGEELA
jgi:glycosyltransferase involved in cell wall biosynthesis